MSAHLSRHIRGSYLFTSRHLIRPALLVRGGLHVDRCPAMVTGQNQNRNESTVPWKPELIVFDQYGTLIDIHSVWQPWIDRVNRRLESATGLDLHHKLYKALDVCRFTKKIRHGTLGRGTTLEIRNALVRVLLSEGMSRIEADRLISASWENGQPARRTDQIGPTRDLFTELKSSGTKIALCSADDRRTTVENLRNSDVIDLVDHVTCGDDYVGGEHSASGRVADICRILNVQPKAAVVIGDTATDMELGRAADVALNIGVLSGVSTRLDLSAVADVVVNDVREAVRYLHRLDRAELQDTAWRRSRLQIGADRRRASVVIFDKDGTLLCFHSLWTPWAENMIKRLEVATGLNVSEKIFHELGYCTTEKRWKPALFAEGTNRQCMEKVADILEKEGLERCEALDVILKVWSAGDHSRRNECLKVVDNPAAVFGALRSLGIKVAVCTADSRRPTEQFLTEHGAMAHVDMIVCGDDVDSVPKPDAHNALRICEALGADPARAVVVGDTAADMKMGRAAKVGATIGVLTGVGDVTHLAPNADYVVPSISNVIDLVTPPMNFETN